MAAPTLMSGGISDRRTFDLDDPIRSEVLPEFTATLRTTIDWEGC